MPVVGIVVGAIGSAVGTAVGAAIGGTILGVSAATIGGVIGAGLAGGVLAAATGGSFGKGFLMGAIGGAVGSFLKGGIGEIFGGAAGDAAGGAMSEQSAMLLAQGGADFMPDALSGMGDLASAGATAGMGDVSATAGDIGMGGIDGGAETFGMGEIAAPEGIPIGADTPSWEAGLQNTANLDQFGDMSGGTNLASSAGFNAPAAPSLGGDQFSMIPEMGGDSFLSSPDASYAPTEMGAPTGGLEGIGQGQVQAPDGTTTAGMLQSQGGADFAPNNPPQGLGGTIKGMANTSDQWLKNTFGQKAPTTGKLLMGGGQYLMDQYQTDKLARQAKGLAPMSFEQYQQQFSNTDDYRNASRRMAQSGRTGTLPALLARLKERTRAGYAGYLPGAQQNYYGVQADLGAARTRNLGNLFKNVMA